MSILYKLAASDEDYQHAKALAASEGFEKVKMDFPTIMAMEGSECIGVLATNIKPDMIMAGPLAVRRDRPRRMTVMNLVDLYEAAMRKLGVNSYIFYTDEPKFTALAKKLFKLEPYAKKGKREFFFRRIA